MIIPGRVDRSNPWHGQTGQEQLFGMTLTEGFKIVQCPAYILRLTGLLSTFNLPPEVAYHIGKRLTDRFGHLRARRMIPHRSLIHSAPKPSDKFIDELEVIEGYARLVRAYAELKRKTRKGERKGNYLYNLAEVMFCLIGFGHNMDYVGKDPRFYEKGKEIVKAFELLLDNAIKKYSAAKPNK